MSEYLFSRTRRRDPATGLRRHIRGGSRSSVTVARPTVLAPELGYCVTPLVSMPDADRERILRQRRRELDKTRGRRPAIYSETLFAGAKRVDWSPELAREWADECIEAVRWLYPEAPIVEAALHGDETQWHVHVLTIPRSRSGRWGQTAAVRDAVAKIDDVPEADRLGLAKAARGMKRVQDFLWLRTGKHFGLKRGKLASETRRKNKAVSMEESAKSVLDEARVLIDRQYEALEREREALADERKALDREREELQAGWAELRAAQKRRRP